MSPSLSGISMVDQANSSILSLAVLDFAAEHLALGSNCIIKVFHGTELSNIVQQAQRYFRVVKLDKPAASRSASKEVYLVCLQKFCLT
jgi:23S rRNA (uridine2552-2'-O)-methyltransferase